MGSVWNCHCALRLVVVCEKKSNGYDARAYILVDGSTIPKMKSLASFAQNFRNARS